MGDFGKKAFFKTNDWKIRENRLRVLRQPRVCNQTFGRRTQIINSSPQIASSPHTSDLTENTNDLQKQLNLIENP
ncbi:hypothetical protein ACE6H2_011791 [Prunus campanulata]